VKEKHQRLRVDLRLLGRAGPREIQNFSRRKNSRSGQLPAPKRPTGIASNVDQDVQIVAVKQTRKKPKTRDEEGSPDCHKKKIGGTLRLKKSTQAPQWRGTGIETSSSTNQAHSNKGAKCPSYTPQIKRLSPSGGETEFLNCTKKKINWRPSLDR